MSKKFLLTLVAFCLTLSANAVFAASCENTPKRSRRADKKLNIKVTPWGPTQADVDAAKQRVDLSEAVKGELNGAKSRQIGFEYLYDAAENKTQSSMPPMHFRVTYYNYSNDMTLLVEGDFAAKENISTKWVSTVPGLGGDELQSAYQIAQQDAAFAPLKGTNALEFYEPMPPVTVVDGERLVNIGVRNLQTGDNQVIGVSFKNDKIVRYANNAPPTSAASPDACGIANAGQNPTGTGLAGQFQLTVNEAGGANLWQMLIVRPSSSSGASFEQSGLEIRDVKYRGKSVLKRGHVPVLNVQYVANTCGPFRDWQYSEGFFQVPTSGVTYPGGTNGGFAIIDSPGIATTAVETGNDQGNFRGVAVYTQDVGLGPEVVLVTEMEAGWYRYVMEWRFATDGTIRPRYGFGSTLDSCVCFQRTHHVYWRFDFDIVNPVNNVYLLDRGRKFLKLLDTESLLFKSVQKSRSLLIQNTSGNEAYQLVPGINDGSVLNDNGNLVDTFGGADFWITLFKGTAGTPSEIDDPNSGSAQNISAFVNGESTSGQDVVVWYAAHQVRSDASSRNGARPDVITGAHVVGPTLRPVRW